MNDLIPPTTDDKNFSKERELETDSVVKESLTVQTNN